MVAAAAAAVTGPSVKAHAESTAGKEIKKQNKKKCTTRELFDRAPFHIGILSELKYAAAAAAASTHYRVVHFK